MNVTQVTVTIHEKRNHPHEYGHYDASVTLVADVEPGKSPGDVINDLRDIARLHVASELDSWIAKIEKGRRIDSLDHQIGSQIYQLRYAYTEEERQASVAAILETIADLPHYLQEDWKAKLEKAGEEVRERLAMNAEADEKEQDDDEWDDRAYEEEEERADLP
ncbi:MAG: hypothetical protein JXA14_26140 [Anaerolineae bacterium]|nr:hypothetical protein [Anaerolineae bacterium]